MAQMHVVQGLTNREFLDVHAAPGRVGLAGGADIVSKTIAFAQRGLDAGKRPSMWSHAFLFQGRRLDGMHWVFESDLEVHRKNIRLGVQENRADKFWSADSYPVLAVLDIGLTPEQTDTVLREALGMVADRVRYSLRELLGTLIGMQSPALRTRANPLSRQKSIFCSAFVMHVMRKAGIDPVPGLDAKHTAPEDLFRSLSAKEVWLTPGPPADKIRLSKRIQNRLKRGFNG